MNRLTKYIIHIPTGIIKTSIIKLFHNKDFNGSFKCAISPITEITIEHGGFLKYGKYFKMRDNSKIRIRKNAKCIIGNNVILNTNNIIACRELIKIGENVCFSPNVQIYDHDHNYKDKGGLLNNSYVTSPVIIGDNVWIGSNSIILRGSVIGNNCVVAAGTIVKGKYGDNKIIFNKRETISKSINY